MADQTTPGGATPPAAGATPAQSTAQQQSATPPATGANGAAGTPTPDDGALGDAGRRALQAERDARKAAEDARKTAEDELKKLRDASLSDSEKRDKRLAELERDQANWTRERQDLLLRSAVERQAAKLGFAHPELALGVLDRSAIEFEASGEPKNLETLMGKLATAYPELVGTATRPSGSGDAGPRGGVAAGRVYKTSELTDRAFYEKNRADILLAAREGRVQEG